MIFSAPSAHSTTHSTTENRTRYWNAYMLFYEEVERSQQDTIAPPPVREVETNPVSPISPLPEGGDNLTQLQVMECLYM